MGEWTTLITGASGVDFIILSGVVRRAPITSSLGVGIPARRPTAAGQTPGSGGVVGAPVGHVLSPQRI